MLIEERDHKSVHKAMYITGAYLSCFLVARKSLQHSRGGEGFCDYAIPVTKCDECTVGVLRQLKAYVSMEQERLSEVRAYIPPRILLRAPTARALLPRNNSAYDL